MHSCPIFIPGQSFIGNVARLDNSRVTWPEKPGSMNPAVECVTSLSLAERALPLQPRREVVGERDDLVRRGQDELPGVEDERLVAVRLDLTGQVGLLDGGIDMRIAVVLEHPEVAVQPHIDARGLHHRSVERVNANPPGIDLGPEVLI